MGIENIISGIEIIIQAAEIVMIIIIMNKLAEIKAAPLFNRQKEKTPLTKKFQIMTKTRKAQIELKQRQQNDQIRLDLDSKG